MHSYISYSCVVVQDSIASYTKLFTPHSRPRGVKLKEYPVGGGTINYEAPSISPKSKLTPSVPWTTVTRNSLFAGKNL